MSRKCQPEVKPNERSTVNDSTATPNIPELIETAKTGARAALKEAARRLAQAETAVSLATENRLAVVKVVSGVLSQTEIAEGLGLSTRQLAALTRDKKPSDVEVVDGRTGEPVEGERAKIATISEPQPTVSQSFSE